METFLALVGVILYLATLWTGFRKVQLGSHVSAALFIIELVLTVIAVGQLGWRLGLITVGGANLIALIASSVRLAFQHDDLLTYAATQAGTSRTEMKALAVRLRRQRKAFSVFGSIRTAQLISYLSQRGRNVSEIEQMAPAIATLWVIHRPELESFTSDYDRLMRLWKKPASEAMGVADVLTIASQKSAATFQEVLDAMIGLADPFSPKRVGSPDK